MNKKNIILLICSIIFLIVAIVIFIFATSYKTNNSTQNISNTTVKSNTNNIDKFNFYDSEGNNYTLEDFKNKPTALILWSSDSENALEIIEIAEKYYAQEEYYNSINFLVVNTNEPDTDIKQHILEAGDEFTIPIYFDTDSTAYNEYNFSSLPYLVFINADGTISSTVVLNETEKKDKSDLFEANLELLTFNY